MKCIEQLFVNIANLFKIKSIITIAIIGTISYLVIKGNEIPGEYMAIASAIITYFFTKKESI
jgi:hypothetical protein